MHALHLHKQQIASFWDIGCSPRHLQKIQFRSYISYPYAYELSLVVNLLYKAFHGFTNFKRVFDNGLRELACKKISLFRLEPLCRPPETLSLIYLLDTLNN